MILIIQQLLKNIKLVMGVGIVILIMLLLRQCNSTRVAKDEVIRITNNNLALTDTINNYIDENGILNGEIRGLHLKVGELGDEVKYEKNKPPVTVVEYITEIRDSIVFEAIVDPSIAQLDGTYIHPVSFADSIKFGKSSRIIDFKMPIFSKDSIITTGGGKLNLTQDIWLEASLSQNLKSKEVFVNLKTDYPGLQFNSAKGILIKRDEEYKAFSRSQRKEFGLGLQLGIGYTDKVTPYIGIGIQYSPKIFQW
tara:strand:+ start:1178 stop:1933 length:756 start_codon:yes stop_codon:yes gene_type:complete